MGEIFIARHVDQPDSTYPVALKRILKHRARDNSFVRMFFKEAKVISTLDHKNLTHVLDFGKEQDTFYMTMDLIDGLNLDTFFSLMLETPQAFSIDIGIEIISQALSGINFAHQQTDKDGSQLNIVHLDLSPHNLMISLDGQIKIIDFGISKAAYEDDHKAYNALRGTYAYMSPEQCREEPVDLRSDLFTLGTLLYELTTLTPLFNKQPSEFMILKAITEGIIPPPSNFIKSYPPELEKVVFKALSVNKEKRYQSATEFIEALAEVTATVKLTTGEKLLALAMNDLNPDGNSVASEVLRSEEKEAKHDEDSYEQIDILDESETVDDDSLVEAAAADPVEEPAASSPESDEDLLEDESDLEELGDSSIISFGEDVEQNILIKQKKRVIYSVFTALFVVSFIGLLLFHRSRTGWMDDMQGGTIYMAQTGTIYVDTFPDEALVFVNKKEQQGVTPLTINSLPFGKELYLEVVLPGYESIDRTITLSPESSMDALVLTLKKN